MLALLVRRAAALGVLLVLALPAVSQAATTATVIFDGESGIAGRPGAAGGGWVYGFSSAAVDDTTTPAHGGTHSLALPVSWTADPAQWGGAWGGSINGYYPELNVSGSHTVLRFWVRANPSRTPSGPITNLTLVLQAANPAIPAGAGNSQTVNVVGTNTGAVGTPALAGIDATWQQAVIPVSSFGRDATHQIDLSHQVMMTFVEVANPYPPTSGDGSFNIDDVELVTDDRDPALTTAAAIAAGAGADQRALFVVGAVGASGSGPLTYTWATLGTPPAAVSFSPNGTAAAAASVATFTADGDYTIEVTITDAGGNVIRSAVTSTLAGVASATGGVATTGTTTGGTGATGGATTSVGTTLVGPDSGATNGCGVGSGLGILLVTAAMALRLAARPRARR